MGKFRTDPSGATCSFRDYSSHGLNFWVRCASDHVSSSGHLTPEEVDEVGLLVAEQVDEHLVLHLREGDPDGGPGQKRVRCYRDIIPLRGLDQYPVYIPLDRQGVSSTLLHPVSLLSGILLIDGC